MGSVCPMDLDTHYPAIADLKTRARRRLPHFVWAYLDSGTGAENAVAANRAALDAVLFAPAILKGRVETDLSTALLGQTFSAPFGIAPVGMSGLIWPDAERSLARLAAREGIAYALSTAAATTPEAVGPVAGDRGWFQLYPPKNPEFRRDLLKRAKDSGFTALVLTVDLAVASRRERLRRSGMTNPPKITPRIAAQIALRPAWGLANLGRPLPRMRTLEKYVDIGRGLPSTAHAGYLMREAPGWDYLHALRDEWDGPLIVKGVLRGEDVAPLRDAGVDAIWVSNHGGRQFDAAPAALDGLRAVRAAAGPDYPLIYDGGVAGGLDALRAIALGADFVMLGRAWHYGLAAFGPKGAAHVLHILREDMSSALGQLGLSRPKQARAHLHGGSVL